MCLVTLVPSAFSQIKADDATFELTQSNTIQKLELYHRSSVCKHDFENVVAKAIGVVFANSYSMSLKYKASSGNDIETDIGDSLNFFKSIGIRSATCVVD